MISGLRSERDGDPRCVPKLMGADAELGNSIDGLHRNNGTGGEAALALLREVDGVCSIAYGPVFDSKGGDVETGSSGADLYNAYPTDKANLENPQDVGRKYLSSNGGCVYIDLNHLEVCTPEVISACDFVAAWLAMLRIIRDALFAANAKCSPGQRVVVLVNSSDGLGNAYGSHLSFLVTRRLWDDLFTRRLYPALFQLAAYQVSSIVFSGQGKVGSENGRPDVAYQISQRADFFDQIVGSQTTYKRPIVNSRDESLCGSAHARNLSMGAGSGLARLHCIFYDSTLCHVSTFLKVGVMQIVLSMLEAGCLDISLMLEDPVAALVSYSHDPGLSAKERLVDGRNVTAVDLQRMFWECARSYVDSGGCEDLVPGAAFILDLWGDTLDKLAVCDFDALAPRIDWVLKQAQIQRALENRGLGWSAPEAKHLDHVYSSLDPDEGMYWPLERAGLTQTLVEEAWIERLKSTPPVDTRAWSRAMLLKKLPRECISGVDWDRIELTPVDPAKGRLILHLPDPLGHTYQDGLGAAECDEETRMTVESAGRCNETILNRGGNDQ